MDRTFTSTKTSKSHRCATSVDIFWFVAARDILRRVIKSGENVHRGRVLAVDHGAATLIYTLPGDKPGTVTAFFGQLLSLTESTEFKNRRAEVGKKLALLVESALGSRVDDMILLDGLATLPAKQGRGYASALVRTLNTMADEQDRAVYLTTVDAQKFYESLGYHLVAEELVGGDNPSWKGEPIPAKLMMREPHSAKRTMGTGTPS
ncbi:hypothetical protein C8T65DRAFT_748857 [Cerioporus squamosus]|nr:hypothetical protein C8T65DRAFT_748857 [Cerioporus squamosus]